MFPNMFRCFPTFSDVSKYFQMFPNIFKLFPTFSHCSQHVQIVPDIFTIANTFRIYPTPSKFIQHRQNLPNTFRIYPTASEFIHPLQNLPTAFSLLGQKMTLGPVDLLGPENRQCSWFWDFGEIEFENDPGNLNSSKILPHGASEPAYREGPRGPKPNSHLCLAAWGALRGKSLRSFFRIFENPSKKSEKHLRALLHNERSLTRWGGLLLAFSFLVSLLNSISPKSKNDEKCIFCFQKGPPAPVSIFCHKRERGG